MLTYIGSNWCVFRKMLVEGENCISRCHTLTAVESVLFLFSELRELFIPLGIFLLLEQGKKLYKSFLYVATKTVFNIYCF